LEPEPLTRAADVRYADLIVDSTHHQLIAVREDHQNPSEIINALVAIPLDNPDGIGHILVSGEDFYMFPRISPDGSHLAWIQWNHPNMPWDGTTLYTAPILPDGTLGPSQFIAGGPEESIFQPSWSPSNELYFISDRTGWWNLYRVVSNEARPITALRAEFGVPAWVFGLSTYGFLNDREVLATYTQDGFARLTRIDVETREMTHLPCPYTVLSDIKVSGDRVLMIAASPLEPTAVVLFNAATKCYRVIKRGSSSVLDEEYLSEPESIEFPTEGGQTAHAFYYPPKNQEYIPPEGENPPLIVYTHGGPTGFSGPVFRIGIQYWTTRGFAVVDVNYGGSAGYGRHYRNRLRDQWGVVDIDDVVNAALFLTRHGKADRNRLVIRGGSAGGYTTMAALTFRDIFKAGASYYGVSDLAALARETHKFESRYLDQLVGKLPEDESRYRERSPLFHADMVKTPLIFFQGLDDHVVLPNQADLMVDSLRSRGIPVAYLQFPGEGHGFQESANIIRAQEAELYFYAKVLGIRLPERIPPVTIDNFG